MRDTKPDRRIRGLMYIMLLVIMAWPCARLTASPYHYAQVLSGIDTHHMMISRATKDPFGMVWMISGGLVYRFDGVSVTPFTKLYQKKLPFYEAEDLHADPWGRLWITTRNGLVLFDLTSWSFLGRDHPVGELVGRQVVACFVAPQGFYMADRRGNVWSIGRDEKRLLFKFDPYAVYERRPTGRVLVADEHQLWLAFGDKLYSYDLATSVQTVARFPDGLFSRMEDLLSVDGGVLIRIYSQGYYISDGHTFRYLPRDNFQTSDFTNWNHWSFPTDKRIVVFHEDQCFEFSRDTAFRLLATSRHQLDEHILYKRLNGWQRSSDEWLLCTERGLYSIFPAKITFDFADCGSARGMIKQRGTYYFGGYGYLDAQPKDGNLRSYTEAPENNYYAFLELSADTACIALEGDFLSYLIRGRVSRAPLHVPTGTMERFTGMAYCVVPYTADTLLVGTYNGIWKYARSSGNVYPLVCPSFGFFSRGMRVQSIIVNSGGITFTTDEGCFGWRDQRFRKLYPADHTKLNVYAHTRMGDSIYLATKGQGLVIIDALGGEGRRITVEDGLASNTVYQMMWVDGALFMGTHEGLSVQKDGTLFNYYHTDGLPFEEFNHQAIYYDAEIRRLFMGGVGGYISFRPEQLLRTAGAPMPNPQLAAIRLGMKSNRYVDNYGRRQLSDTVQLASDVVWFSMDFARPDSYRQMYRMLFKIEPLMDEYQQMPASAQINLSGMSAGNYYVSVKMQAVNDGAIEESRTWVIHKEPAFTETLTFYMLLILVIGGTTGFILYERARKIKGEDRLRRRISRDLHDEVGGLLTGISMQTDLLRLKDDHTRLQSVDSIGSYSREAIQMMDDIIWAVDSRNNQQGSLSDRMKYLAVHLLEPMEITVMFEVDQEEDRKISQMVRQNLYLIYKEAIHNICKHSAAETVYVKLHHSGTKIELIVRDSCNRQQVNVPPKQPSGRRGHGRRNMQLRAEQIGGTFEAGQTADGYEVSVVVPTLIGRYWMNPLKHFW